MTWTLEASYIAAVGNTARGIIERVFTLLVNPKEINLAVLYCWF
jgi:hypothetical protein